MRDDFRLRDFVVPVSSRAMPEDPKVIFKILSGEQAARQAAANAECQKLAIGLPGNLDARRVFFYPACGSDLEPIKRLTHMFEDFVYCDYLARPENWTADKIMDERRGLRCEGAVDLDPATVARLSNEEHLPWPVDHQWEPVVP